MLFDGAFGNFHNAAVYLLICADIGPDIDSVRWDLYRLKTFRVEFDLDDVSAIYIFHVDSHCKVYLERGLWLWFNPCITIVFLRLIVGQFTLPLFCGGQMLSGSMSAINVCPYMEQLPQC